jgi:hypothetical protein
MMAGGKGSGGIQGRARRRRERREVVAARSSSGGPEVRDDRSTCQPGTKRGRRRRGWRRLPVGEVAIRQGATGARAGWADREAEAQWGEGERPVGKKKKEWVTTGPKGRRGRKLRRIISE